MHLMPFSNLSSSRLVDVPKDMQPTPLQLSQPPRQDATPRPSLFLRFIQNVMRRRVSQQYFCIFGYLGVDGCARTWLSHNL